MDWTYGRTITNKSKHLQRKEHIVPFVNVFVDQMPGDLSLN